MFNMPLYWNLLPLPQSHVWDGLGDSEIFQKAAVCNSFQPVIGGILWGTLTLQGNRKCTSTCLKNIGIIWSTGTVQSADYTFFERSTLGLPAVNLSNISMVTNNPAGNSLRGNSYCWAHKHVLIGLDPTIRETGQLKVVTLMGKVKCTWRAKANSTDWVPNQLIAKDWFRNYIVLLYISVNYSMANQLLKNWSGALYCFSTHCESVQQKIAEQRKRSYPFHLNNLIL